FGCTLTRRGSPSLITSRATRRTAPRAQPPPIQPAEIVPSGRMMALAPAFAAVTATVRTTVAMAKGSPFAFIVLTSSRTSVLAIITASRDRVRVQQDFRDYARVRRGR